MSTATTDQAPQNGAALAKPTLHLGPKDVVPIPRLREELGRRLPDLQRLYPPYMRATAARLVQSVVLEVARDAQKKSDDQRLCRASALSLIACTLQVATLQLEIGGPLGQAYLVPYWNKELGVFEATMQLGYRGMICLAYRSGQVASVTAQKVRLGDLYKVHRGTRMEIEHEEGEKRGELTHCYALVKFKGGGIDFESMTVPEIDDHRRKYSKQGTDRGGNRAGVWAASFDAMALKTPLRLLCKRCPVGIDLALLDEPEADAAAAAALPAAAADQPAPRQLGTARETDLEAAMTRKGVSPGDACDYLNRKYDADYPELPPTGDLSAAERQALAEYLAGLPDAGAAA